MVEAQLEKGCNHRGPRVGGCVLEREAEVRRDKTWMAEGASGLASVQARVWIEEMARHAVSKVEEPPYLES